MTVRLYRSSETGAPQLSASTSGDLLNILRACLVEGFGSRTSAGWTMPFSDLPNKVACFKSATGDTLRLDDSLSYRYASGLGFKSMSDLNTGVEQYPDQTMLDFNTKHWRLGKRYDGRAQYNGWMVVATNDWFYFVGLHNATSPSYPTGFFFGKYDTVNPALTENGLLTGYEVNISTTTLSSSAPDGLYKENTSWVTRRSYLNSVNPLFISNSYDAQAFKNPNPSSGKLEMVNPYLIDGQSTPTRLGNLPNRLHIRGNTHQGFRGGELFEMDGVKYVIIAHTSAAYAIIFDEFTG